MNPYGAEEFAHPGDCPGCQECETEPSCEMCGAPVTECACCPDCLGHGNDDPAGSCGGGCDFCPPSRPCRTCNGSGQVVRP